MKKSFILCTLLFITSLHAQNHIIVSKKDLNLIVLDPKSDTLCRYKCAVGLNYGNKQKIGDKRTPEGTFVICSVEDSKLWSHDFQDGAGLRPYAYGPYFIRLTTLGWEGLGIHGTCFPESIGTRSSEGCIRLKNDDIAELIKYVQVGDQVVILKDS